MHKPIKIIDLFAGPGGLGEGFTSLKNDNGEPIFKIATSIEKEASAHATLTLRSFFRQFGNNPPEEYYDFLKGKLGKTPDEKLYQLPQFQTQLAAAQAEALNLTLGKDNTKIYAAIRSAIAPEEDCVLIGGPPCQAYSLAGKARHSSNESYKAEDDERNFLYQEYLRVIARFQPKIFVMENVKGMLSAKINGKPIFDSIRKDLTNPCLAINTQPEQGRKRHKYKIYSLSTPPHEGEEYTRDPRDYIIRSENYGIPQRRHRVIILGVRDDTNLSESDNYLLTPSAKVTTKDVLNDLPKLRSGLSKVENTPEKWISTLTDVNPEILTELRQNKLGPIAEYIESLNSNIEAPAAGQGKVMGLQKTKALTIKQANSLQSWYTDKRLGRYVTNHETRGHLESDLLRYLFCSTWAAVAEPLEWDVKLPTSKHYPNSLKPNHKNFNSGKFADRFRVQIANIPATTITCHISKDGHYYIHYDPLQCRSLTVREAARIQTFPDNYFFVGNRTQQYVQVGNAVPPFLANQIAKATLKILTNYALNRLNSEGIKANKSSSERLNKS